MSVQSRSEVQSAIELDLQVEYVLDCPACLLELGSYVQLDCHSRLLLRRRIRLWLWETLAPTLSGFVDVTPREPELSQKRTRGERSLHRVIARVMGNGTTKQISTMKNDTMLEDEGSTLSAGATPFHPYYEPVNIAIYNDGVPTLVFISEKDRFDILHGIEDQALDDQFPPDAKDAYELEAAEAFVMEMMNLAILEEREEKARQFSDVPKRWEVRRAMGPSGRPRPALNLIIPVDHNVKSQKSKALVVHSHHSLVAHERRHQLLYHRVEPRLTKFSLIPQRPIQQPRKHS